MGGYLSYFVEDPTIRLGRGYSVQLGGYDVWGGYFMTLIKFKQKFSAYHPEIIKYFCGDKCHKMHYFICMINDKAKIIFVLGDHGDFDQMGIVVRVRYYFVRMYNKDKP